MPPKNYSLLAFLEESVRFRATLVNLTFADDGTLSGAFEHEDPLDVVGDVAGTYRRVDDNATIVRVEVTGAYDYAFHGLLVDFIEEGKVIRGHWRGSMNGTESIGTFQAR